MPEVLEGPICVIGPFARWNGVLELLKYIRSYSGCSLQGAVIFGAQLILLAFCYLFLLLAIFVILLLQKIAP